VELRSLRITSCTTAGLDGVIHVGSGVHVVFSNVELVNNGAEGINHSLVVVDSSARLEVTGNSLFSSNHGRVMLVGGGSEVILDNSTFSDNTGNTNGTVLATKVSVVCAFAFKFHMFNAAWQWNSVKHNRFSLPRKCG